jgi:hypothetical protein
MASMLAKPASASASAAAASAAPPFFPCQGVLMFLLDCTEQLACADTTVSSSRAVAVLV